MSSGYDKLKEIGAQKIHEQTHIPKAYTYAIVDRNFEKMNKIQFLGFISILEREYFIKLDELKNEGIEYFVDNTKTFTITKKVFLPATKKRSYLKYYIILTIFILILMAISNSSSENDVLTTPGLDNEKIIQVTQNMATQIEEPEIILEDRILKIIPTIKIWMGYVNLNTGKKFQKTFSDEFELDGEGHWLLSMGHGKVSFEVDGRLEEHKSSRTMRFEYKDGVLKKISYVDYLALSKGEKW